MFSSPANARAAKSLTVQAQTAQAQTAQAQTAQAQTTQAQATQAPIGKTLTSKRLTAETATLPNEPTTQSVNQQGEVLDLADLRRAFAQFGTGVTVVTAQGRDGVKVGVTANSFNTVSLSPPIVLWSLSCRSPSLEVYRNAGHFAVNILSLSQIDLSRRFSQPSADRFQGLSLTLGQNGAPLLNDCAAILECITLSEQTVGDHVLFLGQVERYRYTNKAPLIFYNGQYAQSTALI